MWILILTKLMYFISSIYSACWWYNDWSFLLFHCIFLPIELMLFWHETILKTHLFTTLIFILLFESSEILEFFVKAILIEVYVIRSRSRSPRRRSYSRGRSYSPKRSGSRGRDRDRSMSPRAKRSYSRDRRSRSVDSRERY